MIIKLILICLSNLFFNFFMKMKNKKRSVFRFPIFCENEKRIKVLKIQRKNLLNMKMVVNYLNFVFLNEVKSKSKYRILNFLFQFIKNMKWHFGYTDYMSHSVNNNSLYILFFMNKMDVLKFVLIVNILHYFLLMRYIEMYWKNTKQKFTTLRYLSDW